MKYVYLVLFGPAWAIFTFLAQVQAEELALTGDVSPDIQELEIIYREHQAPRVVQKGILPLSSERFRHTKAQPPTRSILQAIGEIISFGQCQAAETRSSEWVTIRTHRTTTGACGHLLSLQQQGEPMDLLSYQQIHLRGVASSPVTVALADKETDPQNHHVALVRVTGRFDRWIPLGPVARRLDMRRLVSLVLLPEGNETRFTLDQLEVERPPYRPKGDQRRGLWVWDYRQALKDRETLMSVCRRYGITRLMVQMPSLRDPDETWNAYAGFLEDLEASGIEAFALDGFPEAIYNPQDLMNKIRRLTTLLPAQRLNGIQLDIEPYVLDHFFVDETGFAQYLSTIAQVKRKVPPQSIFSVVLPFWFANFTVNGRPVAFSVMDLADDIAVMSYRTDDQQLHDVSEDLLRYGDLAGISVWLAVETRPLPVERHITLKPETRRELADAYIDRKRRRLVLEPPPAAEKGDWFRIHHRTVVRPERLTFAGRSRDDVQSAVQSLLESVSHPSFAGVIIHDLQGFTALPPTMSADVEDKAE